MINTFKLLGFSVFNTTAHTGRTYFTTVTDCPCTAIQRTSIGEDEISHLHLTDVVAILGVKPVVLGHSLSIRDGIPNTGNYDEIFGLQRIDISPAQLVITVQMKLYDLKMPGESHIHSICNIIVVEFEINQYFGFSFIIDTDIPHNAISMTEDVFFIPRQPYYIQPRLLESIGDYRFYLASLQLGVLGKHLFCHYHIMHVPIVIQSFAEDHIATVYNERDVDESIITDKRILGNNGIDIGNIPLLGLKVVWIVDEFDEESFFHLHRHIVSDPIVLGMAESPIASMVLT